MNNNTPKDFIVGDMHGNAETIQQTLKDAGFKSENKHDISIGSPAEEVPTLNNISAAEIVKSVREILESREKANMTHHDAQYEKMYPKKLK